jgi:hypothetical protein
MPFPSDTDITAPVALPTHTIERLIAGVWTALDLDDIYDIDLVEHETTGNRDNPLSFGDTSAARATATLFNTATTRAITWTGQILRIAQGFAGNNPQTFEGVVVSERWSLDDASMQLELAGYAELIEQCKTATPLISGRRAFTATTNATIEDPSNPACVSGYGNQLLWDAGGRPNTQRATYASDAARKFWYECNDALIEMPQGWAKSGEGHWSALQELARAACGQMIQSPDGVVRYWSPFHITSDIPSTPYHLTDDQITGNVEVTRTAFETVGTQIIKGTKRTVQPKQKIWALDSVRYLPAGGGAGSGVYGSITLEFETQWPIPPGLAENLAPGQLVPLAQWTNATLTDFGNSPITAQTATATGNQISYGVVAATAQSFTLLISHDYNRPIQLHAIEFFGYPLQAVLNFEVRRGSGLPERTLDSNALIQDEIQAERLCEAMLAFYATDRPIIRVGGVWYDPRLTQGAWIEFSLPEWGWDHMPCVIIAPRITETGTFVDLDLIPVGDLPRPDDFYVAGASYGTVWNQMLAW